MTASAEVRKWMYATMFASRYYEGCIKAVYMEGKQPVFNMAKGPIPGEMHLSDGQEPCAVGVCASLEPGDTVTATHRPHHVAIAKGVDINRMTAEILGKREGLSGGRGGHMHLFDAKVNFCCSGIIAQGMGPALGAAMAAKMQGTPDVAVSFIGEGAANQGAFHETLNLASVWKAPVVFVIEDNAYGISIAKRDVTAVARNSERAAAYAMPGFFIEGNDPDEIFDVARDAISRARNGGGPSLIEIETTRLEGHFMGDAEGYRPADEVASLRADDMLPRYRQRLIDDGVPESALKESEDKARQRVDEAFRFARDADFPEVADAYTAVFAGTAVQHPRRAA